jgi:predicted HAD superfamily Cof-like phosphohydrolase
MEFRIRLIREELDELEEACKAGDIVEVADALGDIVYVAVGAAHHFGVPLDHCWQEIQSTNMAKVDPATGKVRKRADGKVLKPEGWQPPNIAKALGIIPEVLS